MEIIAGLCRLPFDIKGGASANSGSRSGLEVALQIFLLSWYLVANCIIPRFLLRKVIGSSCECASELGTMQTLRRCYARK